MTDIEAAAILEAHNAWRRDDDGLLAQFPPKLIGEAIDHAVRVLKSLSKEERP